MTPPYLDIPLLPLADALKAGVKALCATALHVMPDYPTTGSPARAADNWRIGCANWHRKRAGPTLARNCSGCRGFTSAARSTSTAASASRHPPAVGTVRRHRSRSAAAVTARSFNVTLTCTRGAGWGGAPPVWAA
jgi:hypothetical protein